MRRVARHFVMTLVFAVIIAAALVSEVVFSLHAKSGRAIVLESHSGGRGGGRVATVRLSDGEDLTDATLRVWFTHLTPGEEVPIAYAEDHPEDVVLDRYFERHRLSVVAFVLFSIATIIEVESFKGWLRRQKSSLTRE